MVTRIAGKSKHQSTLSVNKVVQQTQVQSFRLQEENNDTRETSKKEFRNMYMQRSTNKPNVKLQKINSVYLAIKRMNKLSGMHPIHHICHSNFVCLLTASICLLNFLAY